MKQYDAVFLDVGGVFQLPTATHVRAVLQNYRVAADDVLLHRSHYAGVHAYDHAEGSEAERWNRYMQAYAQTAGVDPAAHPDVVHALLLAFRAAPKWATVIGESVQALRELSNTGLSIAIVSNSDGSVEDRLRADGTCQVGPGAGVSVHCVLDSHVVGSAKPDPGIFRTALEATGARPERTVHVGDSLRTDVQGARGVGITPLHLDPYRHCQATDHDHLRSLSHLLTWLQGQEP
jgi:putative hydrolase of the HAD superfamily